MTWVTTGRKLDPREVHFSSEARRYLTHEQRQTSLRRYSDRAALVALFAAADVASAQFLDRPGVVLVNQSNQEARVYAYAQDPDDRVLLGWIGGSELEYFPVPDEARTDLGHYTVAVQQITPLPQIGVSATPHPMMTTGMLDPGIDGTVRILLDGNFNLTYRVVP